MNESRQKKVLESKNEQLLIWKEEEEGVETTLLILYYYDYLVPLYIRQKKQI